MYRVIISKSVLKSIKNIPENYKSKIKYFILELEKEPFPDKYDIKKLKGIKDTFRCRIGIYRIIYRYFDIDLIIQVIDVDHRKDVYK